MTGNSLQDEFPPEDARPMKELRAMWRRKDEISNALLVELEFSPALILPRNCPVRGELLVEDGELVLLELDLDEDGARQTVEVREGEWDLVHHEVRVPVSAERLAQYRADLDAA